MILQGVIFDLDGTLADTLPVCYAAFRKTFQHFLGRDYSDAEIAAGFGPTEDGMVRNFVGAARAQEALQMYLDEYDRAHDLATAPFPGLLNILDALNDRGIPTAIVTGKGAGSAKISLRRLNLATRFDIVEVGSANGAIKAEAIGRVLERWGIAPENVAYVGDAPGDVPHAREAGVVALSAVWAKGSEVEAVMARQPDAIFHTVQEFADWLGEQQLSPPPALPLDSPEAGQEAILDTPTPDISSTGRNQEPF